MIQALLLAGWLLAATGGDEPPTDLPSRALLEFLGSFETADGEWLDPFSLDEAGELPDDSEGDNEHDETTDPDRPADDPVDGHRPRGQLG